MQRVHRPVRRATAAGLLVLAAAPALAACGEDVVVREAPTPQQRGVAPAAGGTVARDPLRARPAGTSQMTITVDAASGRVRYRAPRTVRGGLVEIRLRNRGDAPRKAQLWRIAGDHSAAEAAKARHPLPDWLRAAGGVSLTPPGATSVSLQSLPAGRYYVADTLGEPGTIAQFDVTGPRTAPAPPRAPARVEARDFTFRVSGLRAGRNSVDVDNTGTQQHHAFFAPMRGGASVADVRRFFTRRTSSGPPPVDTDGTRETVVLEGHDRQVTQLDLPAGRYALVCFVRGRAGGPQHIALGMINEVTVR